MTNEPEISLDALVMQVANNIMLISLGANASLIMPIYKIKEPLDTLIKNSDELNENWSLLMSRLRANHSEIFINLNLLEKKPENQKLFHNQEEKIITYLSTISELCKNLRDDILICDLFSLTDDKKFFLLNSRYEILNKIMDIEIILLNRISFISKYGHGLKEFENV